MDIIRTQSVSTADTVCNVSEEIATYVTKQEKTTYTQKKNLIHRGRPRGDKSPSKLVPNFF